MTKEQNLRDYIKILVIQILVFGIILFATIAFLNKYDLDKYKEDVEERQLNACWLWFLGNDGNGLGAKTYSNCKGFEETCRSDFSGFDCEWLNKSIKGCKCEIRKNS